MYIPFVRSVEEAGHKAKLSELISRLRAVNSVPTGPSLSLRCGSDSLSDKWFASNHEYWVKNNDFEFRHRRHSGRKYFAVWHDIEVFGIPSKCRG